MLPVKRMPIETTTNLNGDSLELDALKEDTENLDLYWQSRPILLSEREKSTLNFHHVCQILLEQLQSPSQLAGLEPDKLTPTIIAIDLNFRDAISEYEKKFNSALEHDKKTLERSEPALKNRIQNQPNYTLRMTSAGLGFLLIGAIPGFFIGRKMDEMKKMANKMEELEMQREGGVSRRAWMQKIDTLEEERYKKMDLNLFARSRVVLIELQQLAKDGETCLKRKNELEQLNRTYCALFPKKELVIGEMKANDFLVWLNREMSGV